MLLAMKEVRSQGFCIVLAGGLVALASVLSLGCSVSLKSSTAPSAALPRSAVVADRNSCEEMFGTAFKSPAERTWFEQNCSRWPLVDVPQTAVLTTAPEPAECAQQRGKPYTSDQQRQFFLQNCMGQVTAPAAVANAVAQTNADPNCSALRGRAYSSDAERAWFLQNCLGQPAQMDGNTTATTGPDRANCDQIRSTPYNSDAERGWFLQNCPSLPAPTNAQAQQPRTILVPGANGVVVGPGVVIVPNNGGGFTNQQPVRNNNGNGNGNGRGRD